MDPRDYMIDKAKVRHAVNTIPAVYPPELAFLAESPIQQSHIVRSMFAGPVYAPGNASFLAFPSQAAGRSLLTLLVTKESLSPGLGQPGVELLAEIYKPPRRVGWWDRLTVQLQADKQQKKSVRQMRDRGELDERLSCAMSKLHFPVFHDDDIIVAFPEDDFIDDTGRSDSRSFDRLMKTSGVRTVCKNIQPLRCGLPASFCNQLLATCRK